MNIINIFSLILTWIIWLWLVNNDFNFATSLIFSVGSSLLTIPLVFVGRWALDRQPSPDRAVWITTFLHYIFAALLGASVIVATKIAKSSNAWPIALPPWLGLAIMIISGILIILVIFNLALKGLGSPLAIALTRVVATEWAYAWTRNPMVLSGLAFLVGLGLWLNSGLFLIWLMAILSPAILVFLRVYEERELEIRFGENYLNYKTKTSWILPKKPQT